MQIGRIATLYERKIQVIQSGNYENTTAELEAEVNDIRRELQYGLTEQAFACLGVTEAEAYSPHHTLSHHQEIITRLFALAASIYLDLVVHGFQREAGELATEAIMILRTHMPSDLMHVVIFPCKFPWSFSIVSLSIVQMISHVSQSKSCSFQSHRGGKTQILTLRSPVYLIGYVAATPEDQQFFRYIFSSSPVLDPSLEHRSKILPLLEDIWQKRDAMLDGTHWEDSLRRLSESNLLLLWDLYRGSELTFMLHILDPGIR